MRDSQLDTPPVGASLPSPDLDRQVHRNLARRGKFAAVMYPLALAVLSLLTPCLHDHPSVTLAFGILIVLLSVARLAVARTFDRWYEGRPRLWFRLFAASTILLGGTWGLLTTFILSAYGLALPSLYAIVIVSGFTAGSAVTLSGSLVLARLAPSAILAPVLAWCLLADDPATRGFLVVLLLDLVFLFPLSAVSHAQLIELFSSRNLLREQALRLNDARVQAEQASRSKSRFLANMSHEIRTPLNGILGFTEFALQSELPGELRESLELVHYSGQNLLEVISDILDISKIEAGRFELDREVFDPRAMVGRSLQSQAERLRGRPVELVCDVDSRVPDRLVGDEMRIRQIVVNLLGNAIKFTEAGTIAVRLWSAALPGGRIRLHGQVRDTGAGIPADKQAAVFEPFRQADDSPTRRHGGTGLGLSICRSLVRMMGGEIGLESIPEQGTAVSFSVLLSEGGPAPTAALPVRRALLVERDGESRAIAGRLLAELGLAARAFRTGAELLAWAADEPDAARRFDVLLLDCRPGRPSCTELAAQLRCHEILGGLPVILTGMSWELAAAGAHGRLEGTSTLQKPLYRPQLARALAGLAADPGEAAAADADGGPGARAEARPLRVLVAEDNPVNQRLMEHLLRKLGHRVELAENGAAAVRIWRRGGIDLILMDVQMPEMDGLTATETIRRLEAAAGGHTPIVALTAHALRADRERCLRAGMDEYLAKPVRSASLRAVLDGVRPATEPAAPPLATSRLS